MINAKLVSFSRALRSAPNINSIIELGCNIGLNLIALNRLSKSFDLAGYEINHEAAKLADQAKIANIIQDSILNPLPAQKKYDLTFTSGVLIHINPTKLDLVYQNLYNLSKQYILIYEYYNPEPVQVKYRGHDGFLFKRDFAGDLIEKFDLELVDYGFDYRRDNYFDYGDGTWFLMRKKVHQ